jgi:hypothetical protein
LGTPSQRGSLVLEEALATHITIPKSLEVAEDSD